LTLWIAFGSMAISQNEFCQSMDKGGLSIFCCTHFLCQGFIVHCRDLSPPL
jgi:hypothetical protein